MAYVRTRLGRWFYEEHGSARAAGDPCIVLLHGLLFDGGMWRACVEPLAALGRVLVIDGPGHGKSDVPPPFRLDDQVEAMTDAMRGLEAPRAIFAGLSWGGMIAMRMALTHPERVAAMALLDTSAEVDGLVDTLKYRALAEVARNLGLSHALYEREIAPLFFTDKTRRERPEIVTASARRVNGYPRTGVARAAYAVVIRRKSILSGLGGIRVPTLVICGREDKATLPARSEAIAARIPGARLVMIPDCAHMSTLEQPEAVNASLVPFVRTELRGADAA